MRAWHFSETAYPYLPPADSYPSIRVSLPNRIYDPQKGAALYDRYIDEWLIAEEEGVEIMLNEHHQTATCVDPAAPLMLAALARLSKKARLLILGNPIANRRQPVRVAEEMAMIDVLSHGRLEAGFVRGVPYEVLPANSNPVRMNERHWEALDLITEVLDPSRRPVQPRGPFLSSPRYQYLAASDAAAASADLGELDKPRRRRTSRRPRLRAGNIPHRFRHDQTHLQFLSQRLARGRTRSGRADRPARLCGADLCRRHRSAGARRRRKITVVHHGEQSAAAFLQSAGLRARRHERAIGARRAKRGLAFGTKQATVEGALEAGTMFAGTPDQVVTQIKKHWHHVGGYGNLLIMGQAGFLEHDDTVHSIRMFAREVYPKLKELFPGTTISGIAEPAAAAAS